MCNLNSNLYIMYSNLTQTAHIQRFCTQTPSGKVFTQTNRVSDRARDIVAYFIYTLEFQLSSRTITKTKQREMVFITLYMFRLVFGVHFFQLHEDFDGWCIVAVCLFSVNTLNLWWLFWLELRLLFLFFSFRFGCCVFFIWFRVWFCSVDKIQLSYALLIFVVECWISMSFI